MVTRIGANIRTAREARGLSQRQLGLLLKVDGAVISRWERGAVSPTMRYMIELARVCEHDLSWFYAAH